MNDEKKQNLNVIDAQGYRLNIGIIVINQKNELLLARRCQQNAWQFPQGGVQDGEKLQDALYRELEEELGLKEKDVVIAGSTPGFLRYRLPPGLIRRDNHPICIGQKQKWYLLTMKSPDESVKLDQTDSPEFDEWAWVPYWYPLRQAVSFKREVYRKALNHFSSLVHPKDKDKTLDPFIAQTRRR